MEQHKSEGQMLFCLRNGTYLLDVTPSNPLPHPLSPPPILLCGIYASWNIWLLSRHPTRVLSSCHSIRLQDPAVLQTTISHLIVAWGFMPWVGGLEDGGKFSHTRHASTVVRELKWEGDCCVIVIHYIFGKFSQLFIFVGVKNIKKGICKIGTIEWQNIFNAKFNMQVIFNGFWATIRCNSPDSLR